MPAPNDEYAPIISEYYTILDSWIAQMPLPDWKSEWFLSRKLKSGIFQSLIMYPFQVGTVKKEILAEKSSYILKLLDYSKKQIPLYVNDKSKQVMEEYKKERCSKEFCIRLTKPKSYIRAREGNKNFPRISEDWTDLVCSSSPWVKNIQGNATSFVISYTELLERICLLAAETEKNRLADEFPEVKDLITSSDFFSDLFFALSLGFDATPQKMRQRYASDAAEHLSALMVRCIEHTEKLVKIITRKYAQGELAKALGEISDNQSFSAIVNTAFNLQHNELKNMFRTAESDLFEKKASSICSEEMWFFYLQYFARVQNKSDSPPTKKTFFIDTETEEEFCTLMAEKLAQHKMTVETKNQKDSDKKENILNYYLKEINTAAILLYMGIYLHFRRGETQLFVKDDELKISSGGDYIAPVNLPLSISDLREFIGKHNPCLLCGGSGSGKSTYLKKITTLPKKDSQAFLLVENIPLRFLVSDDTPQLDSIEPTLETSLIWQKVRQYIHQKNPSDGEKILKEAESNLISHKKGVAPILLLLDGYNEILGIQNEMAVERLQADIKWLASKSNIRIIMTYRTERALRETELLQSMDWFLYSVNAKGKVFRIQYDKTKMMELLKGTQIFNRGVPKRLTELLENRPMYLLAAKKLDNLSQPTQYALLDIIYNQRCRAGLDSPLIRDGKKSRWMALYYVVLPELAYRMVASGNQILERHELHSEIRKILAGHNEIIQDCEDIGSLYWWNIPETCDEIDGYPFKGDVNERDIEWIERSLLGSDKIMDKEENGAIGFFHEDIRNYLAAKHIAQRFQLYVKCPKLRCCYALPIRWERIPKEMRPLVYEALAAAFNIPLKSTEKTDAIQILQELVFPFTSMPTRLEFMLPGDWMRLKLASQIQEYEKQDRSEVMSAFVASVKPLADSCHPDYDYWSLHEKAREILSWTLCRLSQFERQDGKHPVPEKAFQYTELAVKLASDISTTVGEPSQKKIAKHYLAKTFLYQAQYLWTHCAEDLWPAADADFRRGCTILKECADGDSKNVGFNLSNNLLGLWKYSPAPYLQQKPVFLEEIGDIDYSAAFFYFFKSLAFAPAKSANRAYAATKCTAMLLEQQVYLSSMLTFTSLEELWVQLCDNQGHIMTAETAGHGILPLEAPELRVNVQLIGLLLKEAERFAVDERSYYKGLYLLYCAEQIKLQAIDWDKIQEEFEGDQKNLLKDKLCLAFIEANNCLSQGHKRKAKTAWKGAKKAFLEDAQKEFQEIPPHDTGSLDAGHRIHNKAAYNNLLHMLSSQIEKMML